MLIKVDIFCVAIGVIAAIVGNASAYNYLMILPTASQSHYYVGAALAKGLINAGHQMTVISPFPSKKPIANFHDIPAPSVMKVMKGNFKRLLDHINRSVYTTIQNVHFMGLEITKSVLEEPAVQNLLKSNEKFDGIICEVFVNEAHFGFAEHFNAPLIGLGTFSATTWNTDMVGSPSPPSYVPYPMLRFSDRMSLLERIENLIAITYERIFLDWYYLPKQAEIYQKFFPNNKRSMLELRRNAALVLLNQHVSLSFPRPYSPNMIEVGGLHINQQGNHSLPADIKSFIESSPNGVIYFSMGSNLKSKDLPSHVRDEILKTFRSLKQRVLWKFEDTDLPNKPENVFVKTWFPQDDVLAHKNVIAFITHGGLLSTTESIYHGKPLIAIPMFGDQHLNAATAERHGYGISVNYATLTAESFTAAINSVINDTKYSSVARQISQSFRDQKETPLERAVYWVEHVTRQKGASYLRSASQDLSFVQYHNIDVMLILFGGTVLILFMTILIIRLVWKCIIAFLYSKSKKVKKAKRN